MWIDAFQRDTQHLAADEVGAYMLILMAMWTRETCDFPDDDRRLAAVSRVSPRLWKSRIGPVIREFFNAENGALISQRLRKEATYVERQVKAQSDRKSGEKSDKPLKNIDQGQAADMAAESTTDTPPEHPSQLPNNPTLEDTTVSFPKKTAKRKSRIPEDAVISDAQIRAATKRGHSLPEAEAQFSKFKNDALAKGKVFLDWDRAFVTWLDSEFFRPLVDGVSNDNRPNRSQPAQRSEDRPDAALEQIARLAGLSEAQGHGGG